MPRQYLLEILNRCVVIEIVVVLESRLVQCIGGTERDRNRGVGCPTHLGKNQQQDSRQSGPVPTEEEKHAIPSLAVLSCLEVLSSRYSVLSKTDPSARLPITARRKRCWSFSWSYVLLRTGN